MKAYCLFCQTQKAMEVANILKIKGVHDAFSPQIVKKQRVQGENVDKLYNLLPGYVFIYSDTVLNTTKLIYGVTGIIRRLGSPEDEFLLSGGDYNFAMELYKKNGVVGVLSVFRQGDKVYLSDPLFNGCSGKVTQADYKKQRARVEFTFAGAKCYTWIACEFMEKKDNS